MTIRNLDGVYFRVKRDGKYKSLCLSDLYSWEIKEALAFRKNDFLISCIVALASALHRLGDKHDLYGLED